MDTRPQVPCPHCQKSIGAAASEGGVMLRLRPMLVSAAGDVHGGCPHCRQDVIVASGVELSKSIAPRKQLRLRLGRTQVS